MYLLFSLYHIYWVELNLNLGLSDYRGQVKTFLNDNLETDICNYLPLLTIMNITTTFCSSYLFRFHFHQEGINLPI